MNTTEQGTDRLRLTLRIMSDDDLWWFFLDHPRRCKEEFWAEVGTRRSAGTLSQASPFWSIYEVNQRPDSRPVPAVPNVIELTREEWEAHRRRRMFRVLSA